MSAEKPRGAVTASDVAQLAGVSRSAVSRTFTEGASVAPETRERVMQAARDLGYRVNFLARSLKEQRTRLIGLVVSDMDHSLRAHLVDSLGRALVAADYRPFLLPTSRGEDTRRAIDMMLHYNVSGAIVTSDASPQAIAAECARHDVPLVLVNKAEMGGRVANVTQDTEAAGRLAAEALAEAGCRRVVLARQRLPSYTIDLRCDAFAAHLPRLGLKLVATVEGEAQNYAGGQEAGAAFLARRPEADGVYCANDFLALGFMDHLRRRGVSIPDELAIVGCDDIAEAGWDAYDLTTVRQPVEALTQATLQALLTCIADRNARPGLTTIGVDLVRRNSTARS
ncbi:MAG: LacI family transcriptional regulator [Rhodobacteraceae bacterium]|nr:LacI family transcriptional regulator [Paracoccaceae bacterium]MBR9822358.1 LacI family transcriptional regulator [Paracoccaceae bacterium]